MHPIGPELPISARVACARVCRQLYVLCASHGLVQATVGVGTVIIVYIGVQPPVDCKPPVDCQTPVDCKLPVDRQPPVGHGPVFARSVATAGGGSFVCVVFPKRQWNVSRDAFPDDRTLLPRAVPRPPSPPRRARLFGHMEINETLFVLR